MENKNKNDRSYSNIIRVFDDLASGTSSGDIAKSALKASLLFSGGYISNQVASSDFANECLQRIRDYQNFVSRRNKAVIAGGEREVALDNEALSSLKIATGIASDLILPCFDSSNSFSNKIFNDIYNLGLSYVDSVVNSVAEGYVNPKDIVQAKIDSIKLASQGIRTRDSYKEKGFDEQTKQNLRKFRAFLHSTNDAFIRPFAIVPTTRKKIHCSRELMKKLEEEVTRKDVKGESDFKPEVIFPIAHGGTEPGLRIANAYEEVGHSALVYPLLYSIKTRKQRYPWIKNDAHFLGTDLEGKSFLVAEDWVTTGNTLRGILTPLENLCPYEIKVATIKRDREKSMVPVLNNYDFYVGTMALYTGDKTDSLQDL
tara:strand:- start:17542 stop:18654 length:1113 start_codon:yes stop_codon:yes gene_type:complete